MTSGAALCRDVRFVVGLRLAVAAQHGQCVACQRLQLVLAGVDEDRGDEVDMRGDEIREPLWAMPPVSRIASALPLRAMAIAPISLATL